MNLIVYYIVFIIVGDFAAYFLGLFTEQEWGSQVSLIVFWLSIFFSCGCLGCFCAGHQAQITEQQASSTCWQRSLTGHHLPQTASASRFTRSAGRVLISANAARGSKSGLNTSMALTGLTLLVMAITSLRDACS